MSLPTSEPISENSEGATSLRRRRGQRAFVSPEATRRDPRSEQLEELAHRAIPSLDFFLFCLISAVVLGAGFALDAPVLILLAVLLIPFLSPVIGLPLAALLGSGRFFLQVLASTLAGGVIIFLGGLAGGMSTQVWLPLSTHQAEYLGHFSWPVFVVMSLAAVLCVAGYVHSRQKPILPSVAMAYGLYLPAAASAFGLGSGTTDLWPGGLVVSAIYLAWITLLGIIVLAVLRYKPLSFFGYTLGTILALCSLAVVLGFSGIGSALVARLVPPGPLPLKIVPLTLSPTPTLKIAARTATPSPLPTVSTATPTITLTATRTLIPSATPTITATPAPTPVWAIISAAGSDGAFIRAEPKAGSTRLTSLLNGNLVEVLPETVQEGAIVWVHVRTVKGLEGWIVQALLVTATPAPGW